MSGRLPDKFLVLCNGSLRDTPRLLYSKEKFEEKLPGVLEKAIEQLRKQKQKGLFFNVMEA